MLIPVQGGVNATFPIQSNTAVIMLMTLMIAMVSEPEGISVLVKVLCGLKPLSMAIAAEETKFMAAKVAEAAIPAPLFSPKCLKIPTEPGVVEGGATTGKALGTSVTD